MSFFCRFAYNRCWANESIISGSSHPLNSGTALVFPQSSGIYFQFQGVFWASSISDALKVVYDSASMQAQILLHSE